MPVQPTALREARSALSAPEGPPRVRARPSWTVALTVIIVLVGLALRVGLVTRPMSEVSSRLLVDDSYIALDVARSVGTGHGPRAAGRVTNGFQPLWVLVTAPVYALLGESSRTDPTTADRGVRLGLAVDLACDVALILAVLAALSRRDGPGSPGLVFIAAWWAFSPRAWSVGLNGLETALVLALFHATWGVFDRLRRSSTVTWRDGAVAGLACSLVVLARVDQLVVTGAFVLLAWRLFRDRRFSGAFALAWIVPLVVWSIWIFHATGHVYPMSGQASRVQSSPSPHLWPRLAFHVRMVGRLVVLPAGWLAGSALVATVAVGLVRGRAALRQLARDHAFHLVTLALLAAAYVGYQGGWWYFPRYLVLFDWTLALWVAGALTRLSEATSRSRAPLLAGAVALGALLMVTDPGYHPLTDVAPSTAAPHGYRAIGLWARASFPPGTTVGAVQSGALGYYATNLHVVNLDGVTNADAERAIERRELVRYALGEHVEYLLGTAGNARFVHDLESDAALAARLRPVGRGPWDDFVRAPWFVYSTR